MKKAILILLFITYNSGLCLGNYVHLSENKVNIEETSTSVSFTLRNNSLKKIPLKIPGVMNPNLSPMSNSGVSLAIGQKIFFFYKKKKYLLLLVDESLEDSVLLVNELIKKRIEEIETNKRK